MTVEEKNQGAVKLSYYLMYFRSAGYLVPVSVLLFVMYTASQFAQLVSQWWLVLWTGDEGYAQHSMAFYQGLYAAIGLITAATAFVRIIVMSWVGIRASRQLHARLLDTMLRAPLAFFDTTQLGRILVRFSKDTDSIDNAVVQNMGMVLMCVFNVVGSLASMVFATPWFAAAVPPILGLYVYINKSVLRCDAASGERQAARANTAYYFCRRHHSLLLASTHARFLPLPCPTLPPPLMPSSRAATSATRRARRSATTLSPARPSTRTLARR